MQYNIKITISQVGGISKQRGDEEGGGGAKKQREKMKRGGEVPPLSASSSSESERDRQLIAEDPPATWTAGGNRKKRLSKQLSLRETTREAAWDKRRQQILQRQRRNSLAPMMDEGGDREECEEEEEEEADCVSTGKLPRAKSLTDGDLDELRGSIELGFGFSEDGGHDLCHTLPALDLYFAINRQLSDRRLRFSSPSPGSTPTTTGGGSSTSLVETPSPRSPTHGQAIGSATGDSPPWKICSPGDDPQHVKTRLRHWAQAVACSVMLKEWNGGGGAGATGGKDE